MKINFTKIDQKNLETIKDLKAGEWIEYSGNFITLRDSSAMKLMEIKNKGEKLPIKLDGGIILYGAPTEGDQIIIGPTTSKRMDSSLEYLLSQGVIATVGKGSRTKEAVELIKRYKAPYFVMMSGVSAYLSSFFEKGEIIAFKELGPEAVRKYVVKKLPLLVAIDTKGKSIF